MYETALPEFYERASFAPEMSDPSMIQGAENVGQMYDLQENYKMNLLIEDDQLTAENVKNGNISQEIL